MNGGAFKGGPRRRLPPPPPQKVVVRAAPALPHVKVRTVEVPKLSVKAALVAGTVGAAVSSLIHYLV